MPKGERQKESIDYTLGSIEQKVDGINAHLERLNGKTDKSINRIDHNRDSIERLKARNKAIAAVGSVFFTIITVLIAPLFFQYTGANWFGPDEEEVTREDIIEAIDAVQQAENTTREAVDYVNAN